MIIKIGNKYISRGIRVTPLGVVEVTSIKQPISGRVDFRSEDTGRAYHCYGDSFEYLYRPYINSFSIWESLNGHSS